VLVEFFALGGQGVAIMLTGYLIWIDAGDARTGHTAVKSLHDLIKQTVPTWKDQYLADGATEWVGCKSHQITYSTSTSYLTFTFAHSTGTSDRATMELRSWPVEAHHHETHSDKKDRHPKPSSLSTGRSPWQPKWRPTSATLIRPGNKEPTKIRTGCWGVKLDIRGK
jgi:hypothetical protein